jgi:hypothetical protein
MMMRKKTDRTSDFEDSRVDYEDGVDLSLIRWMLTLTPAERLDVLQSSVDSILRMRDGRSET